jgi:N-acetylmuramoyl-L-alanine amidase
VRYKLSLLVFVPCLLGRLAVCSEQLAVRKTGAGEAWSAEESADRNPLRLPSAQAGIPVICIDPGHPSEVGLGAHGRHSTEIEVAYRVAGRLAARLRHEGYRVVLTKHRLNQIVTNRRRAEIANDAHAAVLLRLHCDASVADIASGFAVYYPSRQGRTAGFLGPSQAVIDSSRQAADRFYPAMRKSLEGKLSGLGLKTDLETAIGSKQGALTGSIFSQVPTVLVEMVVLTNPKDEDWILSKAGLDAMVEGLDAGVRAAVPKS